MIALAWLAAAYAAAWIALLAVTRPTRRRRYVVHTYPTTAARRPSSPADRYTLAA